MILILEVAMAEPSVTVSIKVVPEGHLSWTMNFAQESLGMEPHGTDFYNEPPTASQDVFLTAADLLV
jgi:hypothetical protein